jgi:uncharacterized protein (DUF1330 family)
MTHYLVAHVKVNDNRWIPEYAANVHDIVHRHGGKYLTRSGKITALEGEAPATDLVAIIEFPTEDAMNAFVTDPDYAPYAQARRDGTDSQLFGLDVSDVAGTIPYLTGAD